MSNLKEQFDNAINQAEQYSDNDPSNIHEKLKHLGEAQELAGDLWALWENKAKQAEATKDEVINHIFIYGAILPPDCPKVKDETEQEVQEIEAQQPTTDKMRAAVAELVAKPYLDKENSCDSAARHYKNKYYSLDSRINILKKKYDHIKESMNGRG